MMGSFGTLVYVCFEGLGLGSSVVGLRVFMSPV